MNALASVNPGQFSWYLDVAGNCVGATGGLIDLTASGISHPLDCSPTGYCPIPAESATTDPFYDTFRVDLTLGSEQSRFVWRFQRLVDAAVGPWSAIYQQTIYEYPTCGGFPCSGFYPGDFLGKGVLFPGQPQTDAGGIHWNVTLVFAYGPAIPVLGGACGVDPLPVETVCPP